jgi:hypothetical protein
MHGPGAVGIRPSSFINSTSQNIECETVGEKNANTYRRKGETILSNLVERRPWAKRGRSFLGKSNSAL